MTIRDALMGSPRADPKRPRLASGRCTHPANCGGPAYSPAPGSYPDDSRGCSIQRAARQGAPLDVCERKPALLPAGVSSRLVRLPPRCYVGGEARGRSRFVGRGCVSGYPCAIVRLPAPRLTLYSRSPRSCRPVDFGHCRRAGSRLRFGRPALDETGACTWPRPSSPRRRSGRGGRPVTRVIKLPTDSPEEAARIFFAGAKRPDPSLRIPRRKGPAKSTP